MNQWGVFASEEDGSDERHVLPVDTDGYAAAHHPATWCWCRPYRDPMDAKIIVHNHEENSGACVACAVTRALPVFLH